MHETRPEDVPDLLQKQREFFDAGNTRDVDTRLQALGRFQKVLEKNQEPMLAALADDLGKPAIEAFLAEYYFLLEETRLIHKSLKRWLKPRKAGSPFYFLPSRNRLQLEPHGSTLIISPWNYPFQLALSPLIASVAAGNTVILKPSEDASASAALIQKMIVESFAPEHVTVVQGGAEFTDKLLDHPFDFLFFTGSTQVGKIVAKKAAAHLTPHILELGGKCPCVVDETADPTITAKRILVGKLFNAGQTCFAPDFVAVQEDAKSKLVDELQMHLDSLPWEQEMACIINDRHYARLQSLITGKVIQKGQDDAESRHFAPRILPDATWDDVAMKEEIFGPILPIVTYRNREELTEKLSRYSSPLALYCFSNDQRFNDHLLEKIPSGSVCLNDVGKQASNLKLPFGGKGDSGHGRYRGKASVEAFSYQRAISKRFFLPDPFESLPPRAKQAEMLRKMMK